MRAHAAVLLSTALLAGCRQPAAPPTNQSAHDAHAAPPTSAARTSLFGNLGAHHRTIRTSSPDAQKFFDEGLTLLFGFNHEEAFRLFERAAALDPASPMPHWGMALSLGTNINDPAPAERITKAAVHLAEAEKRAAAGSEVERALVAALGKRYVAAATGGQAARERAYSDAMGALSRSFPDDLDVATLYAESLMNLRPWRLYAKDGTPEPGTDDIVATLERVLAANPHHPGANHYYIHAVEASNRPDRALVAAERLETLVPGAGHLVHMPAHVYIRTGQYARSATSNAQAARVDEKYFESAGTNSMYAAMYYGHNLQFESAAAMFAGHFAQARAAAKRTVALADPVADQMAMIEPFVAQELMVLVRFGHWAPILEATAPAATRTIQTALYHFARGAAFAGQRKVEDAEKELAALNAAMTKITPDAMVGAVNSASAVTAVAVADLTARVAEAKGETASAIRAYSTAIAAEEALGYNEPPDWLIPERERLGALQLKAKRFADAEATFRADLKKNVGNPRSLYGVYRSLAARKHAGAAAAKAAFDAAIAGADVTLDDDLYGRMP